MKLQEVLDLIADPIMVLLIFVGVFVLIMGAFGILPPVERVQIEPCVCPEVS